jgi:hypothetical protein
MIRSFTQGDNRQLIGAVDALGRRWTQIVADVGFPVPRSTLELTGYEYLEGEEHSRLAMLPERECFPVEDPWDGVIEIHFTAQSGDGTAPEAAAGVLSGSTRQQWFCSSPSPPRPFPTFTFSVDHPVIPSKE